MKRWILRFVVLGILGFTSYCSYDAYQAGYFSLPDLPDGSYTLSFENGLRAILMDAEVPNSILERKYLGIPFEVQPWFEDAWSWCKAPTAEDKAEIERMPDDFKRTFENARLEAVCRIDVDGTEVWRGLIYSVPRL